MSFETLTEKLLKTAACALTAYVAVAALAQTHTDPNADSKTQAPKEPPAMQAPGASASGHGGDAVKVAHVFFISPKDGATVPQEFTAKFGIEGMKVEPAGAIVPGSGHHHLIVDAGPTRKGDVVPADATHLHFGKAQTEAKMKLAPGHHTLTLQFADGAHRSYGEEMSQTIHITVK